MSLGGSMSNDRLRAALRGARFSEADFAEELGVDPKTVQRWITKGRTPHRATALRAAKLLEVPPAWLWPELDSADASAGGGEVVAFYPHRSNVPKSMWLEMISGLRERLDLLSYASLFLPEDNPEAITLIKHKAESGVAVRIALGDPTSHAITRRGQEERMPDGIPGRVRMALAYYQPLVGVPGVEFHLHSTTLYNSIFRFDDEMLVNQHVYGTYGYLAPILHLRRSENSNLFDTYVRSFDLVWSESVPHVP